MVGHQLSQTPVPVTATPTARERLSQATLAKGKQLVENAWTGWDYGVILDQFSQALAAGFAPRNLNAAFLGFVRKKVAQRP